MKRTALRCSRRKAVNQGVRCDRRHSRHGTRPASVVVLQADKKNAPTVYLSGQSWVLLTIGDGCQQQMKPIPALLSGL